MEFPEVWSVKQKFKAVKKETFTSSDAVAVKISSKLPLARMVRFDKTKTINKK